MVPVFGELEDVRLHVGPASARAATLLDARAFTIGRDIHFAAGAYQPGTPAGLELLDHEVAHAAQPEVGPARGRPLVARSDAAAERDARGTRGARATREALIHRFPERGGLTEHEVVPPPFLMQFFDARILVALELGTPSGTPAERAVKFAIQVQGTSPIDSPDLVDRELRIQASTARRAVNASIVRLREDSVAIDLYGDGLTIVVLDLELRPDQYNRSRDYHMFARELGRSGGHSAVVRYMLPELGPNDIGADGGAAASSTLTLGGDDIKFVARRFSHSAIVVTAQSVPLFWRPGVIATWVLDGLRAGVATQLAPASVTGSSLAFDLDGDGDPDLRLLHHMADWAETGATGREHAFDAFDRHGVRIGTRGRVISGDTPGAPPRPAIPADQLLRPGDTALGEFESLESVLPSSRSTPGGSPRPVTREDSTIELRLDADGDRHQELLLLLRPHRACRSDGTQGVDFIFMQISSRATSTVTINMMPEQAAALSPTVARATDGSRSTEIDLVASAYDFRVAAPPLRMSIGPAEERCGQRYHQVLVGNVGHEVVLPCEVEHGRALAHDVSEAREVGGMRVVEATLGEYGDRFRFVFHRVAFQDFLAISGMSRRPDGTVVPGETRRVSLLPGAGAEVPSHVTCDPQELRLVLGDRVVSVRDALSAPYHDDPLGNRIHELSVSGSAVLRERTIRFDVGPDGFWLGPRTTAPTFDERLIRPRQGDDHVFDAIDGTGNLTMEMLRSALDADAITQDFHEAARGLHVAMLRLRVAVWASWRNLPGADVGPTTTAAMAAIHTVQRSDGALIPPTLVALALALSSRNFGSVLDHYPSNISGAFIDYIRTLDAWESLLRPRLEENALDREATAAAGTVDTLVARSSPTATIAGLLLEYDAAIGSEVVSAHRDGLITDALYRAWDRLRRNMPQLRVLASSELETGTCELDGGRIAQTSADAATIAHEITEAMTDASAPISFAGYAIAPSARLLASAVTGHDWPSVFSNYDSVMRGLDGWVSDRIRARYGDQSDEYKRNQHLHHMRDEVAALAASHPDAIPVAATFAPDSEYRAVSGGITSIPLTVIVYRDGGSWRLHDLTPQRPYLASVGDRGEAEPPYALFAELDDNDRFPKGILYYQIPGGSGGRVLCTAEKDWYEWVRDFGLVVAAIGIGLATFGTGTVAVVGAYFLAGAAIANAIAAGGELYDTVTSGQATTTSIILNIVDIIASLAGAGALVSGTVVRSASAAARAGMAWTGAAARVAAFADRVYIPLTAASTAGDVATVAVMSADAHAQLTEMEQSGASPEEIASARKALLVQLAITGGLTAMSVRGDLPEIRMGRRHIVLDVVGDVAVARAAGVRIQGIDLDLAAGGARAHATARWHAEDVAAGRVSLGDDTDNFYDWHRRWLELPERVSFHPDGTYEIRMPRGENGELPPESVRQRLTSLAGPESTVFPFGARVRARRRRRGDRTYGRRTAGRSARRELAGHEASPPRKARRHARGRSDDPSLRAGSARDARRRDRGLRACAPARKRGSARQRDRTDLRHVPWPGGLHPGKSRRPGRGARRRRGARRGRGRGARRDDPRSDGRDRAARPAPAGASGSGVPASARSAAGSHAGSRRARPHARGIRRQRAQRSAALANR